jgi:glucose-6-phosphate isomerase
MTLPYKPAADLADQLLSTGIVSRIWARDVTAWRASEGSPEARSISSRLGWLDIRQTMEPEVERLEQLGREATAAGISAVYLLGMGGSSLCAEVIRSVFADAGTAVDLFVLDTTDELTITTAAARMDLARTWVLVASKSGTTVEVASLERFFWSRFAAALGDRAGSQFIAITDPGTALEQLARTRGYRDVFLNPADIGGRFSALSLFGLVPAALVGAPVRALLDGGETMAEGCRQENHLNAGLELGSYIGAAALNGRDKLTVILPPSLLSLGLWIEQLIAESTGKHGKGALPVVDERLGRPDQYGDDRAFVSLQTERDHPDEHLLKALEHAGHPVLRLSTRLDGLGAEFFRWEFATAVAGAALGINPFDEPNVAEAKDKTKALIAAFESSGTVPQPAATASSNAVTVSSVSHSGPTPADVVASALASLAQGDYVAFLSYLPPSTEVEHSMMTIREALRSRFRVATTFGVGPRYLHSTGQYHKGGPNTALAFVITGQDETATPIPEAAYTFSVLKRAQALGDAETLSAHRRRTVLVHVKGAIPQAPVVIETLFKEALEALPAATAAK